MLQKIIFGVALVASLIHAETFQAMLDSCEKGDMQKCAQVGYSLLSGRDVQKDPQKAFDLLQKSCNAGVGIGCTDLADLYDGGEKIYNDPQKAFDLKAQGCMLGDDRPCEWVALQYELGTKLIPQNREKMYQYLIQGCEVGWRTESTRAHLCNKLGGIYEWDKKGLEAGKYLEKACSFSEGYCKDAGTFYLSGKLVAQDISKAKIFFQKGCDVNDGHACTELGLLAEKENDLNLAIKYYEKSVKTNNKISLIKLGQFYEEGKVIQQDLKKASEMFKNLCKGRTVDGCMDLGRVYEKLNQKKEAAAAYKLGCRMKKKDACAEEDRLKKSM